MTLEKFFLKESLKINMIIIFCISLFAFYFINIEEIRQYREDYKERVEKFQIIFELELDKYKKLVYYLGEDRELDLYAKYGIYLYDSEVRDNAETVKIKKESKPIKKYLLMSRFKNIYGMKNRDLSLEVYNKKAEIILGKKLLLKEDKFIKSIDFRNRFDQVIHFYILDNDIYIRIYGMARSKEYIVVLNYKLGSDFLDRMKQLGMKVIISNENGKILSSSFLEGERLENVKMDISKKEYRKKINNVLYSFVRTELYNYDKKVISWIYVAEKTDLPKVLLKDNLILLLIVIFIGMYVYTVFRSIYKNFIKLIFNIKRNIEGKESEGLNYQIKEQDEILEIVEEYRKEKDQVEKIILKEIGTKTRELKNLNYEMKLQNNLLKELAGKEDVMDILGIAYVRLNEVINLEELQFVTLLKDSDNLKIIKVNSNGSIQEFNQVREKGMQFILAEDEDEMHIFEAENDGKRVISINFDTKNIEWGVLSIVYSTKKVYDKRIIFLVRELASLIALILKSAKLYEISIKDSLTNILNRSVMNFYIEKMIKNSIRYNKTFSILMIDIDFFKQINDEHGHVIGDFVLKKLVKTIELSLREVDTVFRYGGEEFLVLLPEENEKAAKKVAERIRTNVMETSINLENLNNKEIKITVSIGVAEYNIEKHKTVIEIVEEADEKLYLAKENGRNRVY